jgi:hypothetical protein
LGGRRNGTDVNRFSTIGIPTAALLLAATAALAQAPSPGVSPEVRKIQRAHLDAQLPPKADFDRLMSRDLTAYFTKAGEPAAKVSYEMLRKGPTLAGVSSPKYYAWVTVGETSPVRGAVRLKAVDGERFEVMEFFSVEQIRSNHTALESVFPKSVIADIDEKVAAPK